MGNLELAGTVKMLEGQRAEVAKELTKLDKAIAVLRGLNGTSTPSQNGKGHTLSAAARKKIGRAQKARWAKVKQAQKAKG